jgi:NitT/TauT family transport system ATP-binding protein
MQFVRPTPPYEPEADSNVLIRFDGVAKRYRTVNGDFVRALDEVSVSVCESEFLSIVGPSGCGKSTLLKILAGIISASSGTLYINGSQVSGPQQNVGVVFQEATLLPWHTVLRNVLIPADVARIPRSQLRDRAIQLLRLVGLEGFQDRYPNELSGGMQQRAAICRALLRDPAIVLMDEPFGALDALTRDHMNLELLRIWEAQHNTILFVTHSITEAVLLSDRVIVMSPRPGRILEEVVIDLPRPRKLGLVNSPSFGEYADHIRGLLDRPGALFRRTEGSE